MSVRYEWYLLYHQRGKTYVLDRFESYDPNESRRNHAHSCEFHWVTPEMEDPRVSALEAVDGRGRVVIRESCRPGEDPARVYKAVPPPPGLLEPGDDPGPSRIAQETPKTSPPPRDHPWE